MSEAIPLVKAAWPRFVNVKLLWFVEPTTTVPKSIVAGKTASCPGVSAEPVSKLVLLPPLLRKMALLVKNPLVMGVKTTLTSPVWPGATL